MAIEICCYFALHWLRHSGYLYTLSRILGPPNIKTTQIHLRSMGIEQIRESHRGREHHPAGGSRKEPTEEEKQWTRTLDNYGYSISDDLDTELIKLVEVGFYDNAAFAEQLEKKNEEARGLQGKESYHNVWDIYGDSFDDNAEEFLEKLVATFRTHMKYLALRNLQNTVEMARAFNQNEVANSLIDEFFEFHKDNPGLRVPLMGSERRDINDQYLLQKLKEVSDAAQDQRTLAEVVKKITNSNGWSPDDISLLASCEVDDYYNFFKTEKSERLYYYVQKCLEFRTEGTNNGQTMSIGEKAREALIRIANESPIRQCAAVCVNGRGLIKWHPSLEHDRESVHG